MKNLIDEKQITYEDIKNFYISSEKIDEKIGIEYERISLNNSDFKQADFNNIFEIIKNFSKLNNFELVYDNETIIGAKNNNGSSISLEPGGQFEISLAPSENLSELHFVLDNYIKQLDILAERFNIKFFAIGCNPKITYKDIKILNKRRYQIMANYLFKKGKFAPIMMRETAGIQINVDYKNAQDAELKMKAAILMSPFLTGFFANSPFRNNKLTNYKSIRALAWKYTGVDRCNLFYKNLIDEKGNIYEQYIDSILNVPMIFIVRNNEYIELNGKITFKEFMKNGYGSYFATMEDYLTHQSLCFPDVRLKNCIEIRNHDSQNPEIAIAIGAIYKGILYNKNATNEIINFLSCLNSDDLEKIGFLASKYGVDFYVEKLNFKGYEIVKRILYLAQYNLEPNEKKYLDWLIDLVTSKRCVADLLLETIK